MQLGEDRVVNDDHSSHSLFYSDLVNHLYGFQLGAEGVLWTTQSLHLGTGIKAGIYHNSARIFAAFPQPGPAATLNAGENHAAFCGDLWLDANY